MNKVIREIDFKSGKIMQIISGDITQENVDAIVNAANAYLQHGGGVARVISLNGGSQIQIESDSWIEKSGPVSHESPAYTSGGALPCKYVIHAVGPVWGEGDEDKKLTAAISGSLNLSDQLGLTSISFPAISTGIFGFPKERAAKIILKELEKYFEEHPGTSLELIRLVLFDEDSVAVFLDIYDSFIHVRGNNTNHKLS